MPDTSPSLSGGLALHASPGMPAPPRSRTQPPLGHAVQCRRCGKEWPHGDPALRVACPTCQAPPGRRCRRPFAHECVVHPTRDGLATGMGLLTPCPALTWDGRHAKPLPFPPSPPPPRLTCTVPSPRTGP